MASTREIVTKAVVGKGKKTFTTTKAITPECVPTTILGCWVINHNFKGFRNDNKINIEGSYDVNIWYSCSGDTKTEVFRETVNYLEEVNVPSTKENEINNEDIIIRSLKQPTCTKAEVVNGKIEYTVQKELGVEIVGDVKVKIAYDEEEDPWEIIMDDSNETDIEKVEEIIEQQVNEEYLD